ncbi:MAG: DMT family transporter [Flavobacteriales bacterium]|nr:DMT family transporter [Flavobacteriales bacterium]
MNKSLAVHLALFAVAVIYGVNYTVAKGVMPQYLGASGFVLIRIGVAALLFNVVAIFSRKKEKIQSKKDYGQLLIAATFGVAGNMLLFFNGLAHTTEINASVLMQNAPIFVLIFSFFLYKKPVSKQQVAGILIAAAGAILLIGGTKFQFGGETVKGDIMVTLNAISFAMYLVYVTRLLEKYSTLFVIRHLFVFGFFLALPFGLADIVSADYSNFPSSIWISIGYVAILTTFVAYLLNAWAVQRATPALVSSYIYLQPVVAIFVAVNTVNQSLSLEKIIFAGVIFTGVYLVSFNKKQA